MRTMADTYGMKTFTQWLWACNERPRETARCKHLQNRLTESMQRLEFTFFCYFCK